MTLNDYQEIEKELTPSAKSANIYVSVESDDDVMEISVLDENGNTVALISDRDIEKQEGFYRATITVDNPHLWSPGKAYLYSVKVGGSEYGADTIAGYHKLPPVAFTEEFQCEYLSEFNKVFDQLDFMIGEHVWAYCDFQTKQGLNRVDGNKKGVFTRNRQPKAAAFMLKDRWSVS